MAPWTNCGGSGTLPDKGIKCPVCRGSGEKPRTTPPSLGRRSTCRAGAPSAPGTPLRLPPVGGGAARAYGVLGSGAGGRA